MSGTLYVVATPLGNLGDLSPRALETLKSVDFILAEDTRVTLKILRHFGVEKRLISYSEHSSELKERTILEHLAQGKNYALVSDAGTPCVSDPGGALVGAVLAADLSVVPVPGPSALTAIASVFGAPFPSLHFWGFFPVKKKRQSELVARFQEIPGLHVFFESPFRVEKTFATCLKELADFRVALGREMTKKFETYLYGSPAEVLEKLKAAPVKGEFCVALMRNERAKTHYGE